MIAKLHAFLASALLHEDYSGSAGKRLPAEANRMDAYFQAFGSCPSVSGSAVYCY
jgi:hypothetical protein